MFPPIFDQQLKFKVMAENPKLTPAQRAIIRHMQTGGPLFVSFTAKPRLEKDEKTVRRTTYDCVHRLRELELIKPKDPKILPTRLREFILTEKGEAVKS